MNVKKFLEIILSDNPLSVISIAIVVTWVIFNIFIYFHRYKRENWQKNAIIDFEQSKKVISFIQDNDSISPVIKDMACKTVSYFKELSFYEVGQILKSQLDVRDLYHVRKLLREKIIEVKNNNFSLSIKGKKKLKIKYYVYGFICWFLFILIYFFLFIFLMYLIEGENKLAFFSWLIFVLVIMSIIQLWMMHSIEIHKILTVWLPENKDKFPNKILPEESDGESKSLFQKLHTIYRKIPFDFEEGKNL